MIEDREFQSRLQRVEGLIGALEACQDREAREKARELVRALLDLHARGIARILELAGAERTNWAQDRLVSSMLLLHGLHPTPLEERVRNAIANTRPRLRARGVDMEALDVSAAHVRIRLLGDPTQAKYARDMLEEALTEAAPDVQEIAFEENGMTNGNRVSLPLTMARG